VAAAVEQAIVGVEDMLYMSDLHYGRRLPLTVNLQDQGADITAPGAGAETRLAGSAAPCRRRCATSASTPSRLTNLTLVVNLTHVTANQ